MIEKRNKIFIIFGATLILTSLYHLYILVLFYNSTNIIHSSIVLCSGVMAFGLIFATFPLWSKLLANK